MGAPAGSSPPTLSLPRAVRFAGIGEKFAANSITATGSMSVPIAISPRRSGFGPQLSLSYDSGAGNGQGGAVNSKGSPHRHAADLPQLSRILNSAACEAEAHALSDALVRLAARLPNGFSEFSEATPPALSPALCAFFSLHLGCDFSGVRIVTDDAANTAAREAGASAFTVGQDISFAKGFFSPDTEEGFRLLAHEIVHVVQQGCAPWLGHGTHPVRRRSPMRMQKIINAQEVYNGVCPPGSVAISYPSSGPLGTAFGKYLGHMFLYDTRPDPYCVIDFGVFFRGQMGATTIYNMARSNLDPSVMLAFVNRNVAETWRWLQRTDILDAEHDHVYEIKPLRSRDEGVDQLREYLTALNQTATVTGPIFPVPRSRHWVGGNWDPSPHGMVVPGAGGQVCLLHAWQDPLVQGLIVYDIVCCASVESVEAQIHLHLTKVKEVSKPILDSQPAFAAQLKKSLDHHLPKAPVGSSYAFLVPWRVFQTYVLAPMDAELNRKYDSIYSRRLSPAQTAFLLETFVLAHVLPGGQLADVAAIVGGYMIPEEIYKIWGIQLAGSAAFALGAALVGVEISAAAAVAEVAPIASGLAAAEGAGAAATGPLIVTSLVEPISAVTIDGVAYLAAGEAAAATTSLPAWMIAQLGAAAGAAGPRVGMGVVAVLVTQFATPAEAATPGSQPGSEPEGQLAGADPIYLAPVELLQPKRGEIKVNAEVFFGGERFFVIALAGPD